MYHFVPIMHFFSLFKIAHFSFIIQRTHTFRSYAAALSLIVCDPMDYGPPDFSVHGILQARILEWVPFPSPEDLPDATIKPCLLCLLAGGFFTTCAT